MALSKDKQNERNILWHNAIKEDLINSRFPPRTQIILNTHRFKECKYPVTSTYMHGAARTGKTIEVSWRVLEWHRLQFIHRKSGDFIFYKVSELLEDLRDLYLQIEKKNQFINSLKHTKLLVLNDFGPERITDWAYQMLYNVIDYRYEHLKTTFITSNLSIPELADKLNDDRIPTRFAQDCKGHIIKFNNKPYI